MTFAPILSKQGPSSGLEKKVYSANLFNTTTGAHSSQGVTYPINMIKDVSDEFYYFAGAQVSGAGPAILVQPINMTVTAGAYGPVFSVQATSPGGGSETQYAWYKNGVNITSGTNVQYATPDSTLGTILVPSTSGDNGSTWYCIVSNPSGAVQSNTVTLKVSGTTSGPVITGDGYGSSISVPVGGTYPLSTNVTGSATLVFDWHKVTPGGTVGGAGDSIVSTNAGVDGGAPYHIWTSSYTTAALTAPDNGCKFYCHISNPYGSVNSTIANVTVGTAPVISSGPLAAVTVTEGSSFSRTVTLSAGTPAGYYWYIKPTSAPLDLMNDSGYLVWSDNSNITNTSTYNSAALTIASNGKYLSCAALNNFGTATTNTALITVNAAVISAPTVYSSPSNVADPVNPFTMSAVFVGDFLTYQWQYKTIYDAAFNNWAVSNSTTDQTSPTRHTNTFSFDYSYGGTGWMNGTQFRCIATNSAGSATTTPAIVTVGTPPPTLVSITVIPSSGTLQGTGDSLLLTATALWSDTSVTNVDGSAVWSSNDTGKVTMTQPPVYFGTGPRYATATAVGPAGSVTVTCTFAGGTGTSSITCTGSTLSSISISPLASSVAVGSTILFASQAHWSNAAVTTLTENTVWSSSNTGVATIGAPYGAVGWPTASGISAGSVTITANAFSTFGMAATTTLTVTAGGGGGGSTLYYRPTTGTGSTNFAGAIDTTSATIDYSTFTNKATSSPTVVTNIFSGFGTGTVSGTLNVRITAITESMPNIDDTLFANSRMLLAYSYNGGSYVTMVSASGGTGDPSAATPISVSLSGVDLSTLLVKLVYNGDRIITLAERVVALVDVTLYDVVFLT